MSSSAPAPYGAAPAPVRENVSRGMLFALAAVIGAIVLTIVLFEAGFLAGLSGLVVAAGSVALYVQGAGTAPRRGLKPLIALILVGGVVAILAAIFVDVWRTYDKAVATFGRTGVMPRGQAITDEFTQHLFHDYGSNIALYALFFALGSFGTLRRLVASRYRRETDGAAAS